jgi:hypothetical protein
MPIDSNNQLDINEILTVYYLDYYNSNPLTYYGLTVGPQSDFVYGWSWDGVYNLYTINTSGQSLLNATFQSAPSITLCLLPSTLIKLANNQYKQAGHLVPGDLVATPAGPQAIKFVGKTTRNLLELRATGRMPIRIDAGALGDLGPDAPIDCTPSHAFHIKGCLVEAQALINGSSIVQLQEWDSP